MRVRNALNPLLWACVVVPAVSWTAVFAFRDDLFLRYFLVTVGSLPIFVMLAAYLIHMFRDPNRLQSEEFVLRQQELSSIEHKGRASPQLPSDAIESDDLSFESVDSRIGHEP